MDWAEMFDGKAEAVVRRDDMPPTIVVISVFDVAADLGARLTNVCGRISLLDTLPPLSLEGR